jgi:hypothetical protein
MFEILLRLCGRLCRRQPAYPLCPSASAQQDEAAPGDTRTISVPGGSLQDLIFFVNRGQGRTAHGP